MADQNSNYQQSPGWLAFVDYIENPREYSLAAVQTIMDVHTGVSDLY